MAEVFIRLLADSLTGDRLIQTLGRMRRACANAERLTQALQSGLALALCGPGAAVRVQVPIRPRCQKFCAE